MQKPRKGVLHRIVRAIVTRQMACRAGSVPRRKRQLPPSHAASGWPVMILLLMALTGAACVPLSRAGSFLLEPTVVHQQTSWSLVNIRWDIGRLVLFQSLGVDVTIDQDVPDDLRIYIAPLGSGRLSGTSFYGGLQTQIDGYSRHDHQWRNPGRGLIFSMWDERSPDAIRPSVDGLCLSSGSEGDYVSVRRPYPWTNGTYTYRLVRMDRQVIAGRPYTWVGAFVYSHQKDEHAFVGALRFKGDNLVLHQLLGSFVELYSYTKLPSTIPELTLTFGNVTVNGKPVESLSAVVAYQMDDPGFAEAVVRGNWVVVKLGRPVVRR